jgi:predicted DNA-binding protein
MTKKMTVRAQAQPTTPICVRVPLDLKADLHELAEADRRKFADYVRLALEKHRDVASKRKLTKRAA